MTDKRSSGSRGRGGPPGGGKRSGGDRPAGPRDGARSGRSEGFRRPANDRAPTRDGAVAGKPARGKGRPGGQRQPPIVDRSEDEARIAKVIARAGLCSRRDAEAWIAAGRVAVNGTILRSPALNVSPQDDITVDGMPLAARERTRLFLFHKPRGCVTTDRDPEGRPTIFSVLPEGLPRLVTIGRLDINTEGLLMLTNDGGLARVLELPATGWLRRYRVRARGETDQAALDALRDGVSIEGIDYAGIEATLDRRQGANVWLTMGLREGKNREVKRVLETLGLEVNRLIRLSFGPFQLGNLAEGAIEEVSSRVLRDQIGGELAKQAGVDFEGAVSAPVVTQEVRQQRRDERRREGATAGVRKGFDGSGRRDDRAQPRRFEGRDAGQGGRTGPIEAPERKPHPGRPKVGARKHISALRSEPRSDAEAPRQRIERSHTADRRGRSVAIERVVKTAKARSDAPPSRNARRFAKERAVQDDATGGHRPKSGRDPQAGGGRGPRPRGGERPLSRPSSGAKPRHGAPADPSRPKPRPKPRGKR